MAHLDLSLLGSLAILLDGRPVSGFVSDKVRALLVYLVVEMSQAHRREALAALLWPERSEANARANLSQALFNLRSVLGDRSPAEMSGRSEFSPALVPFLRVDGKTIQFNAASDYRADVISFQSLVRACADQAHPPGTGCEAYIQRLGEAVALYRGPFLGDLAIKDSVPFEEWVAVRRERLLDDILRRLRDPTCRLLTLVGPGGCGKTRLALEVGERLVENRPCRDDAPGGQPRGAAPTEANHPGANHPVASPYLPTDGVFLVSLASLRSPETIVPTIAVAVGCSLSGRDPRPPEAQLLDHLRHKAMLLILYNCEHLLPEMRLVSAILEAAPEAKVLATTRERLNVQGEHLLPVSGMELPEVGGEGGHSASECGAVQLFLQGAWQVRPGYEPDAEELEQIVRVCRRVQGMPLAIVLATGWMVMLGPGEIEAEIARSLDFPSAGARDLPERQRSVRATFEHSWRLLAREEQSALAALSVCRGSCDYEAACAVSGAALITVRALVDKSLLQMVAGRRFEMHELLRQYAVEMLERSPEALLAARTRHAAHYIELLARLDPRSRAEGWAKLSTRLYPDIENARAAWEWSAAQGDLARLERGMVALCWFYFGEGRTREGIEVCDLALAAEAMHRGVRGAVGWPYLRGQALTWKGSFQHWGADYQQAKATFRQGLEALQKADTQGRDTRLDRALAFERLCDAAQVRGDYSTGVDYASESLALFRQVGENRWVAQAQMQVGWMACQMGRGCTEAQQALEESVMIHRQIDDRRGLARTLGPLAIVVAYGGDLKRAERLAREALAIAQEGGERVVMGVGTFALGDVLIKGSGFAEAESLLERTIADPVGANDQILGVENYALGMARMHLGSYAQAYPPLERAKALGLRFGGLVAAHAVFTLGSVAMAEGNCMEAAVHYEEALPSLRRSGAICLRGLGGPMLAELGLGHRDKAKALLMEDLRSSAAKDYVPWRAGALAAAAAWLAVHGQAERAVEIYAAASQHPQIAASRWWADVVGRYVAAAASALSQEVVATARERGRAADVPAVLCELLAELSEREQSLAM